MTIKHTLKYADEPGIDDLMVVKKFNDWILHSKTQPVPKMLFGEFWLEGEMAVLTGESGSGKSLLGVQIGESIARGEQLEPFGTTAKPQEVLYVNLKLSDKQIEMRYAEEYDPEQGEFLKQHHKFSNRFHRVDIDLHGKLPNGVHHFEEIFPSLIERAVRKHKAKVVIIDSLTCLQRSVYGYRETIAVMKGLDWLKKQRGLSILVLARTSAYGNRSTGSSQMLLSRFADSMFTIGQSRVDTGMRYLKHLTARSTAKAYDASHVPSFRITRLNGNFLGFEHYGFGPESEHLATVRDHRDWPLIQKIKEMSDEGMTVREIAAELEMPKTSVHRYLQMWRPEDEAAATAAAKREPATNPLDFPGCEEYDEALRQPCFQTMFENDDEEAYKLRAEYNDIERARYSASKEYKNTGTAPTLAEMLERISAEEAAAGAAGGSVPPAADGSVPPAVAGGLTQRGANMDEEELRHCELNTTHPQPPTTAGGTDQTAATPAYEDEADRLAAAERAEKAARAPGTEWGADLRGLERSLDNNEREIFIEQRYEKGKPQLWYMYDKKGRLTRSYHKGYGSIGRDVDGPMCPFGWSDN